MGVCASIASCHHQRDATEECKPELASGRFESFSKSMSRSFSFIRDAPRFSYTIDNGDYSILAKSQTTGTTTIHDIKIALEKLSSNHTIGKSQGRMSEENSPNSTPLFPPLILHLSNVLAAKHIAALETGKGDLGLGIPAKSLRSRSLHDTTLSSSFRSVSFNTVSSRRHTKISSHNSWEATSSDQFKSFEKSIEM